MGGCGGFKEVGELRWNGYDRAVLRVGDALEPDVIARE